MEGDYIYDEGCRGAKDRFLLGGQGCNMFRAGVQVFFYDEGCRVRGCNKIDSFQEAEGAGQDYF